jgi:DNA-binding response OmpR family regulator
LGRLDILFVDNEFTLFRRVQNALGKECLVHYMSSVSKAKEFLHLSVPDVLISEVALVEESGLNLCRYVRSCPEMCTLPMLLLTSCATLQDKVAGFQAGADDYLVKPCDVSHLLARVRLLLRIKRLERCVR